MTKVNRSPKQFSADDTFTLYMGKAKYVFQSDIFAKMSKKCAKLIQQGIHQGTIMKAVRQDTFEAFIAACQLQPFKVSAANVYELLDLSIDWQVTSLEKFANDFIESKKDKLQPPPKIDYIELLINRVQQNIYDINDIRAVSAIINEALLDSRFSTLPPEVIFQVILSSDPHEIDQQLLIDFVLSMFDKKPSTAVPLTLFMNFDLMSGEQNDKVFFSKKMHEENLGFFVSWILSYTRNNSERELQESFSKFHQDFGDLYENMKKASRNSRNKLKKLHDQEIAEMEQTIAKQKEELEKLIEEAKEEDRQIEEDEKEHQAEIAKMKEELAKIEQVGEECNIEEPDTEGQIKSVVNEEIEKLKEDLNEQMEKVRTKNQTNCQKISDDLMKPIDEFKKVIDDMLVKSTEMTNSIDELNTSITEMKSSLTAKIVRDKLRCDKSIRDIENRFKLFENKNKSPWNLSADQIENSERFINALEVRLDQLCPIRGNQQCSPPQTPMAAMLARKDEEANLVDDSEIGTLPLSPTRK